MFHLSTVKHPRKQAKWRRAAFVLCWLTGSSNVVVLLYESLDFESTAGQQLSVGATCSVEHVCQEQEREMTDLGSQHHVQHPQ